MLRFQLFSGTEAPPNSRKRVTGLKILERRLNNINVRKEACPSQYHHRAQISNRVTKIRTKSSFYDLVQSRLCDPEAIRLRTKNEQKRLMRKTGILHLLEVLGSTIAPQLSIFTPIPRSGKPGVLSRENRFLRVEDATGTWKKQAEKEEEPANPYDKVGRHTKVRNWIVLKLVFGKLVRKETLAAIRRDILKTAEKLGDHQDEISYSTLRRIWVDLNNAGIADMVKAYANGKFYDKFGINFVRPKGLPNELWMLDWTTLPMTVRSDDGKERTLYLTLHGDRRCERATDGMAFDGSLPHDPRRYLLLHAGIAAKGT